MTFYGFGSPVVQQKNAQRNHVYIGDDGACCWSDPGKSRDRWVSQPTRMEPPGEMAGKA